MKYFYFKVYELLSFIETFINYFWHFRKYKIDNKEKIRAIITKSYNK